MPKFKNSRTPDPDNFPICPLCDEPVGHGQEAAADRDYIVHLTCWKHAPSTIPAPPGDVPEPSGDLKCTRCSLPIEAAEPATVIGVESFHTRCWRILASERAIVTSRAADRRSRETLDRALDRLGKGAIRCVVCGEGIERVNDLILGVSGPSHRACVSSSDAGDRSSRETPPD